MLKWIKDKWTYISKLGVKPEMSIAREKKVILTNQLSIIFFFVLMGMNAQGIAHLKYWSTADYLSFLSVFTILSIPMTNAKTEKGLAGFIICVATTFFTFLFSIYGHREGIVVYPIYFYIFPKMLGLAYVVLPFVLIDSTKKWQIVISVSFAICCIFLHDKLLVMQNAGFYQVKIDLSSYSGLCTNMIFPILFIVFGMVFMVNINTKYEKKIVSLLDELKDKNMSLESHRNEISAQMETIQQSFTIIEQKNKNIMDSIQYAKSIQSSFLPSDAYFKEILPSSFILYLPRDVVSGDFYWVREIDNLKIVIAADCTGHGVPGAFVSILGSTLLNDIIISQRILEPNLILDELRIGLKQAMKQTHETKQKDGMDISVCVFDPKTMEMKYAGANQSLIVCRQKEMIEIKSDHQPVGIYVKERPFTQFTLQMQAGDHFYIFSDGFQSQFGGENREKMKAVRFKSQLLAISDQDIEVQKQILSEFLQTWKGSQDQIDDILVIGVQI